MKVLWWFSDGEDYEDNGIVTDLKQRLLVEIFTVGISSWRIYPCTLQKIATDKNHYTNLTHWMEIVDNIDLLTFRTSNYTFYYGSETDIDIQGHDHFRN